MDLHQHSGEDVLQGPVRTGMDDSADFERGGGMRLSIATLLTQVSHGPFASLRAVRAGLV